MNLKLKESLGIGHTCLQHVRSYSLDITAELVEFAELTVTTGSHDAKSAAPDMSELFEVLALKTINVFTVWTVVHSKFPQDAFLCPVSVIWEAEKFQKMDR